MQRNLSATDLQFEKEIALFLDEHAPKARGVAIWEQSAWLEALSKRGWVAPAWPRNRGGSGWSETQKFIWYSACHRYMDGFLETPGIAVVGPLLTRFGSQEVIQRYLPKILDFTERWCVAFTNFAGEPAPPASPGRQNESQAMQQHSPDTSSNGITLVQKDDGWLLEGCAAWVSQADRADFVLGVAELADSSHNQRWGVFVCPLNHISVERQVLKTLSGGETCHVWFHATKLESWHLIGKLADAQKLNLPGHVVGKSAVVVAQMQQLDAMLLTLEPNSDVKRRRDAAEIDLTGLMAMELRYVDALERGAVLPFPTEALALKLAALESEVGALLMDSFGYYALPYPDMWLEHNLGEVGPRGARAATTAWLERTEAEHYASVCQDLYGKLAHEKQDSGEL